MLLEAILRRIHETINDIEAMKKANIFRFGSLDALIKVLEDVHPNKPEKPRCIDTYYDSKGESVVFSFEYKDERKNREMNFDEFHQYFCTVLGEKEC